MERAGGLDVLLEQAAARKQSTQASVDARIGDSSLA
jgi:hypothetical protein